jgi:competence protein ComEA
MKRKISWLVLAVSIAIIGSGMALTQTPEKPPPKPPAQAQAQANQIDINTASLDQLKTLPGIGDSYAKKIIAGRPYSKKSDLVQRGIIPEATYKKIAGQIIARQPK